VADTPFCIDKYTNIVRKNKSSFADYPALKMGPWQALLPLLFHITKGDSYETLVFTFGCGFYPWPFHRGPRG
jgi:hypothetical protein